MGHEVSSCPQRTQPKAALALIEMIQPNLTRRQLLVATGGALALAACDSGSKSATPTTSAGTANTTTDVGVAAPESFQVVQRFPNEPLTPGELRLPVSLADQDSNLVADGPATLTGWIEDFNGERVADIVAKRRNVGIAIAYWEVRTTLPEAKIYTLHLEGDDGLGATFELFDATDIASPLTGKPLPPFDTPTVDNHRGVEPYCSLTPAPCPLHDATLTDALASAATNSTPLIYMVGTPAHCQTGTCAPGLEFLVAEHARVGEQVAMVHADVYADDAATTIAPAIIALNVQYEPIIYLCSSDGVIVDRLDGIWDASELRERIDLLLAH